MVVGKKMVVGEQEHYTLNSLVFILGPFPVTDLLFLFHCGLLCSWPCLRLSVVRRACWLRLHCCPRTELRKVSLEWGFGPQSCPELERIWKPQQISMPASAILTVCAYVFVRLLLPSSLWLRLALYSILPCRTWPLGEVLVWVQWLVP